MIKRTASYLIDMLFFVIVGYIYGLGFKLVECIHGNDENCVEDEESGVRIRPKVYFDKANDL